MAARMSSDKPTLVLLHGWGLNQGVWQGITHLLGNKLQILTPDLPGFGLNRPFPKPYQLDAVVEQLAQEIPADSYVCGWSLGGLLAIGLASRFPEKVLQLGLVAASPCFMAQPSSIELSVPFEPQWPGMAQSIMQQFAQSLSNNLTLTIERFLAIQAMGSNTARQDIKALKQTIMAYPTPELAAIEGALQLLRTDLRDEFSALTQPIVGLYGRLDALVPAKVVERLQQLQPQAQFSVLEHVSHAPFISAPTEFVAWLNGWLQLDKLAVNGGEHS
ncbi:pimeloyl-[acyl-carrier protein] methyl ester esterase [Rheinheimera sp. D18]|nr:pimeloyl-[acyl-carrier protein] methyl ester esterase [Rheinheimera sp. D18]